MGRVLNSTQKVGTQSYAFSYDPYTFLGGQTGITYSSGKKVTTEYDDAGRIAGLKNASGSYYAGATPTDPTNRI
jgi:hypothetical protein